MYAGDQALQVSSGVAVLPDRVKISTSVPDGVVPRQLIAPQVDDHLRVARLGFVRAPRRALRSEPEQLARIRGRVVELAARSPGGTR